VNALKAQADEVLKQTRASQAEADDRLSQLEGERNQVLAAARTDAEHSRQQAVRVASAVRADAETERERILGEARTTAANVVADAHRAAAADVDRLREHLRAELPRSLDAVLNDAIGQLPRTLAVTPTVTDAAEAATAADTVDGPTRNGAGVGLAALGQDRRAATPGHADRLHIRDRMGRTDDFEKSLPIPTARSPQPSLAVWRGAQHLALVSNPSLPRNWTISVGPPVKLVEHFAGAKPLFPPVAI
jgi:vacuolar-type H+-ATPase subunit H